LRSRGECGVVGEEEEGREQIEEEIAPSSLSQTTSSLALHDFALARVEVALIGEVVDSLAAALGLRS